MEIFRVLYLKNKNEFDSNNIGNHWTINENWAWMQYDVTKNSHLFDVNIDNYKKFLLVANIENKLINDELTNEANDILPREQEITTNINSNINFEMYDDNGLILSGIGSTGERYNEIN